MPQARDIALEQLTSAGDALPVMGTRVDPAHSIGDALVRAPALAELPVAAAITDLMRVEGAVQLQSQADQLAAHLRQRQQELDRREAQLNSRLADFEKEVREARLWLAERNAELNEREAKTEGSGTQRVPGVQGSGDPEDVPLGVEPGTNSHFVGTALSRRAGIPPAAGEIAPEATSGASEQSFDRADRESLLRKSDEVDRRRAALEIFQKKVSQMHHEALELRLAAEEAQAELRASLGVEQGDHAVTLARQRLARYFHDEAAELTRKREELEGLKLELAAECDRVERHYEQLKELIGPNGVDSTSPDPLLIRR
jgi:hypothetical protein